MQRASLRALYGALLRSMSCAGWLPGAASSTGPRLRVSCAIRPPANTTANTTSTKKPPKSPHQTHAAPPRPGARASSGSGWEGDRSVMTLVEGASHVPRRGKLLEGT